MRCYRLLLLAGLCLSGCSAIPDIVHQPQYHNPFPQLNRVAILPFYNQSDEPTVDGDAIALAYYNELQAIPGFEVVPIGVAKTLLASFGTEPIAGEDFQKLAAFMDVDAVIVGSVTDYSPYYPPRIGLAVRWYAANPGFHPIPPGYGLPWGTSEEEFIPDPLVFEAEFALAKEQLKTQTPQVRMVPGPLGASHSTEAAPSSDATQPTASEDSEMSVMAMPTAELETDAEAMGSPAPMLPADWPDPRGFVPAAPSPVRPEAIAQSEPVLSLTQLYHGNDAEFTKRLANYFYFRDEARSSNWQAYLQRSEDFIRFCCHLHITELLAARGGAGKTRVVWRWPIGRYHR